MLLSNEEKLFVKEILYNSLAQALIRLAKATNFPLKLFLFIFIISTNSLAAYFTIVQILSYFNYEVTTTTRTIHEKSSPFPKVTICNRNRFQTQFAFDFLHDLNKEINSNVSIFLIVIINDRIADQNSTSLKKDARKKFNFMLNLKRFSKLTFSKV